jgi:hypothetical protein
LDLLVSKLTQKTGQASLQNSSVTARKTPLHMHSSPDSQFYDIELFNHSEILESALYLIAHMSAGAASHRQLVMAAQSNAIPYIPPLFAHPDPRVRQGAIMIIHNLLWVDDVNDFVPARKRALELRAQGVQEKLKKCTKDDVTDVREKAKSTMEHFEQLLGASGANESNGHGVGSGGGRASMTRSHTP